MKKKVIRIRGKVLAALLVASMVCSNLSGAVLTVSATESTSGTVTGVSDEYQGAGIDEGIGTDEGTDTDQGTGTDEGTGTDQGTGTDEETSTDQETGTDQGTEENEGVANINNGDDSDGEPVAAISDDVNNTVATTYASWDAAALAANGMSTEDAAKDDADLTDVDFTYSKSYTSEYDNTTQYIVDTIYTALGFAYFAYTVNNEGQSYGGLTITLANDIDLEDAGVSGYTETEIASDGTNSWTSIGTGVLGGGDTNPFSGSFDGNEKTISSVYINSTDQYQGLFGYMQTSSVGNTEIKDLTVKDVSISGTSYVGALVGYLGADITVNNVTITDADITGTGDYVAGAIAFAYVNTTINNVDVLASRVTQAGTGTDTSYIGGVVGYAEVSNTGSEVTGYATTITGCDSNATITIESTVGTSGASGEYAGGIVGRVYRNTSDTTAKLEIKNCSFSGTIEAKSSYFNGIGGIAGGVYDVTDRGSVLVEGCYNTGDITGEGTGIGGIIGRSVRGVITKCYNTGDITSEEKSFVGGIAGYASNPIISYCYNTGAVQGYNDAGGIIGYIGDASSSGIKLEACYSIGTVSVTVENEDVTPRAGGIVGYWSETSNTKLSVTNCYYNTDIIEAGVGYAATGNVTSGVVGLTTLEMTGTTDGDNTDNDTDRAQDSMTGFGATNSDESAIWTFATDVSDTTNDLITYCYYPVLTDNKQDPAPYVTDVADVTTWTDAASLAVAGTDYELDEDAETLVIYTSTGLAYFADTVNDGITYEDYTVSLANNIDLDDGTVTGYGLNEDGTISDVDWTPIGTYADGGSNPFSGTFDGKGYTISGIYISSTEDYQGLFGYISGATIQNVGIIDSRISATNNVGAVVGQADDKSTIQYCYNTSEVAGNANTNSTGGIVGYLGGEDSNEVSNCYNTGNVTGAGIVGTISVGVVRSCYNIGEATAPIVSDKTTNSTVSNCYYDSSIYTDTDVTEVQGVTGLTTEQMTGTTDEDSGNADTNRAQDSMVDFDTSVWTFTEDHYNGTAYKTCYYPVLTSNTQDPQPSKIAQVTTVASWAAAAGMAGSVTDYVLDEGAKTLEINTVYGLAWFASQVNSGTNYSGYTVTLMDDIDLTDANVVDYSAETIMADDYVGTDTDNDTTTALVNNSWTAIGIVVGTTTYSFQGTFDGNGKTISGVYINSNSVNQGLFGSISSATIKNLTLSDSQISGGVESTTSSIGGIVGYVNGTTSSVSNCTTTSTVTVTGEGNYIGGVVGNATGTISNCTNNGTVSSTGYYVGGVAGYANNTTILGCANYGQVSSKSNQVGGIVGKTGSTTIAGCTNNGEVSGESE